MNVLAIAAYIVSALLILLLCRIFYRPLKHIFVMLFSSALGGACLYIFNLLAAKTGFVIGINIVTASVCGLLGLPGFVLLVFVKFILQYVGI